MAALHHNEVAAAGKKMPAGVRCTLPAKRKPHVQFNLAGRCPQY
jgi:hypothetical protein